MNLEELKQVFKDASLAHEQIKTFQIGNNYNIAESNAADNYPLAFYELPYSITSDLKKKLDTVQFSFNIFLLSENDNVKVDHEHIAEAKTIGDAILKSISDTNDDFYFENINSVSVREFSDDNCSGIRYDLTLIMKNLMCEVTPIIPVTPTPTPSVTPTPTITSTPTPTPSATPSVTPTPSATPSTTPTPTPIISGSTSLVLTYTDLGSVASEMAGKNSLATDPSDVSHWNKMLGLPAPYVDMLNNAGNAFTGIVVDDNVKTITLNGGSNIQLGNRQNSFGDTNVSSNFAFMNSIIKFEDNGSIIKIQQSVFQSLGNLTHVKLSSCLEMVESYQFYGCTSLASAIFPVLTKTGDELVFNDCALTHLELPSCTQLGLTTSSNNLFAGITGKVIDVLINPYLLTVDGGNPDGDLIDLQNNNTVNYI